MPRVTSAALRKTLASGSLAPVYLLTGDDEREKASLTGEIVDTVDEAFRGFNVQRFHGTDASIPQVLDAARTMAFGSGRRVVVVHQAERLLEPKRESQAAARDVEAFLEYLDAPVPETTLVIVAGALDGRTKFARTLKRKAVEVECDGLEGLGDAARWVRRALAEAGLDAERPAVQLIVERAGGDVGRLRAETERVQLYCAGQSRVTREDVLAVVGSPMASDDWAVTNAIQRGQTGAALRELALTLESGAVAYMVLGQLAWFVRAKLPPDRVPAVIDRVFETDLALKTSTGDPRVLLERLVTTLCDGAAGRAGERVAGRRR